MLRQEIRRQIRDILLEHQLNQNQSILSVELLTELLTNQFVQMNLTQLTHQLTEINQDVMQLVNLLNQQLIQSADMHSEISSWLSVLKSQSSSNITMQMRVGNLKSQCDEWKREQTNARKQLESSIRKSVKWFSAIEKNIVQVDAMEIIVHLPKDRLI